MADVLTETNDANLPALVNNSTSAPGSSSGTSGNTMIRRDVGDIPEARRALVKQWSEKVTKAKTFWDKTFKRMKSDMDFLIGIQWEGGTEDDERYVANITLRHVNERVAAIYAKNPTVVARRTQQMDFQLWDETPGMLKQAQNVMSLSQQNSQMGVPLDPMTATAVQQAVNLMKDVAQGMSRRQVMTRVAKTLELYFQNKVLREQIPPFKSQMKQLVRRVEACAVGYVKLGIMREMEHSPEMVKRISSMTERLAEIQRMMADLADNQEAMDECCAEAEELRIALETLQNQPDKITREGIVFDFPTSMSIIPDPKVRTLDCFLGGDWVAEEFIMSAQDVKTIWKVDVGTNFRAYSPSDGHWSGYVSEASNGSGSGGETKKGMVCVWQIYDKKTGTRLHIADGYPDFLEEPTPPEITLERFYPWFPLMFNQVEHHKQVFPLSDVHLLRHPQREYNRSRQGLREHRHANRPMTIVPAGKLDDEDKRNLESRPANAVVELKGLQAKEKVDDVLQSFKGPSISQELYDTSAVFQDVLRTVGSQEANLGGTSNATATESSIAEGSRISSIQSNVDDLDDFLTEIMRAAGQVALKEIGAEEIQRVCGRGAVWPQLSGQDIADEIYLEVQAGSSGRPNKAAEMQNFTQLAPFLVQIPGLDPLWMLRQAIMRLDDRLDPTDAILEGMKSIVAQNAAAGGKPPGQPTETGNDPNAQGPRGATNAAGSGNRAPPNASTGGNPGPQEPNPLPVGGGANTQQMN